MPTDLDRARKLLPHWIEHNTEHAEEFRDWSSRVRGLAASLQTAAAAADAMAEAAAAMEESSWHLQEALRLLGQ